MCESVRERKGEREKERECLCIHARAFRTQISPMSSYTQEVHYFSKMNVLHLLASVSHHPSLSIPWREFLWHKKLLFLTSMHGSYTAPLHTHTHTNFRHCTGCEDNKAVEEHCPSLPVCNPPFPVPFLSPLPLSLSIAQHGREDLAISRMFKKHRSGSGSQGPNYSALNVPEHYQRCKAVKGGAGRTDKGQHSRVPLTSTQINITYYPQFSGAFNSSVAVLFFL